VNVIYYGVGAEPAGAFENANSGAERSDRLRSNTEMDQLNTPGVPLSLHPRLHSWIATRFIAPHFRFV